MSNVQASNESAAATASPRAVDMKLEVVVLPVSDVDRAKALLRGRSAGGSTPTSPSATASGSCSSRRPARGCSIHLRHGLTSAAPGSAEGLLPVVSDIEAARAELVARGVDVSEVFHDERRGSFHHAGTTAASAARRRRRSYGSFASFSDPDGNGWLLQEITTRLPGPRRAPRRPRTRRRAIWPSALRRAAAAHGEHEERTGEADAELAGLVRASTWSREQAGEELPT